MNIFHLLFITFSFSVITNTIATDRYVILDDNIELFINAI